MKKRKISKCIMTFITLFSASLISVYSLKNLQFPKSQRGIYSDTVYVSAASGDSYAEKADVSVYPVFTDEPLPYEALPVQPDFDGNNVTLCGTESDSAVSDYSEASLRDYSYINVYNHKTGSVLSLPLEEYVACVVAAEMPANSPAEALKAQAVAVRTLAVNYMSDSKKNGHGGADICTDSGHCQSFVTKDELTAKYGDAGENVFLNATNAAFATKGLLLLYREQPIVAVFHASSGNSTASGKEVWGGDLAYLTAVETHEMSDVTLRDKVIGSITFTRDEFIRKLSNADIPELSKYKESPFHLWIGGKELSESGRVSALTIAGKRFSGAEVRKMLGLKSTDFEISFADDSITFTTRGYGHGVGMSQLGAVAMANKGESFYSILSTYYPGTVIGFV